MIKTFKQFVRENCSEVAVVMIEATLPSVEHDSIIKGAKNAFPSHSYRIYVLPQVNEENYKLSPERRLKLFREAFQKYGRSIKLGESKTEVLNQLEQDGYETIKEYTDDSIQTDSLPLIVENQFQSFLKKYPFGSRNPNNLFNELREELGLERVTSFRRHIELPTVSSVREQYIKGKIFQPGEWVRSKTLNKIIEIQESKSNFVIDTNGRKHFIDQLQSLTENGEA